MNLLNFHFENFQTSQIEHGRLVSSLIQRFKITATPQSPFSFIQQLLQLRCWLYIFRNKQQTDRTIVHANIDASKQNTDIWLLSLVWVARGRLQLLLTFCNNTDWLLLLYHLCEVFRKSIGLNHDLNYWHKSPSFTWRQPGLKYWLSTEPHQNNGVQTRSNRIKNVVNCYKL